MTKKAPLRHVYLIDGSGYLPLHPKKPGHEVSAPCLAVTPI